ncbi:MAG: radical SAM protein, partial [candidate division NC10 bacterium]|nr:radical SAM protein [candidate division NC10 bacterium]
MSRLMESRLAASDLDKVYQKILHGTRLDFCDGLALYQTRDLTSVAFLANLVRERMSGNLTYFVRNLHINYTNICNKGCKFCSFYAPPSDPRGYVLSIQDIRDRVRKHDEVPIREIHIVAGINPKLPYEYYLDLVRAVKNARPGVQVKAFTMIELAQIQRVADKPLEEVLAD